MENQYIDRGRFQQPRPSSEYCSLGRRVVVRVGVPEVALSREPMASRHEASPVRVEEESGLATRILGEAQPAPVDATAAGEAAEGFWTLYVDFVDQHNRYNLRVP